MITPTPLRSSSDRVRLLLWGVFGVLLLGFTGFHGTAVFGFDDDYLQLRQVRWDDAPLWNDYFLAEGRPFYGVFTLAMWSLLESIDQAFWYRLFGLLGVWLFFGRVLAFLRRDLQVPTGAATLWSLLILLTPSVLVSTFWAATALYVWVNVVSFAAGAYAFRQWLAEVPSKWGIGGSSLVLLGAQLTYQPAASCFLLPATAALILRPETVKVSTVVKVLGQFLLVAGLYFVGFKVAAATVLEGLPRLGRSGELSTVGRHLHHYLAGVLPLIASHWAVFWGGAWGLLAQTLSGAGILLWVARRVRSGKGFHRWLPVGLVIVLLLTVGAPLIASGVWTPFRTLTAPVALILLLAGAGWVGLFQHLRLPRQAGLAVGILGVLLIAGLARSVTTQLVIQPLTEEHRRMVDWIENEMEAWPETVTAVAAFPMDRRTTGLWSIYEYGRRCSQTDWVLQEMLYILLPERFQLPPGPEVYALYPQNFNLIVTTPESDAPWFRGQLLDARRLLGQEGGPTFRPDPSSPTGTFEFGKLGTLDLYPSGWARHPAIGWLRPGPGRWFRHEAVGWILLAEEDDPHLFEHPIFGHLHGSPERWPNYLVKDEDSPSFRRIDLLHSPPTEVLRAALSRAVAPVH